MRSSANYRIYDQSHLKRLDYVKRTRELGFTLKEVRKLLELVDGGDYTCAEVLERTRNHLHDVVQKIADLRKMQRTLKAMVADCDADLVPQCPIIDQLTAD